MSDNTPDCTCKDTTQTLSAIHHATQQWVQHANRIDVTGDAYAIAAGMQEAIENIINQHHPQEVINDTEFP